MKKLLKKELEKRFEGCGTNRTQSLSEQSADSRPRLT